MFFPITIHDENKLGSGGEEYRTIYLGQILRAVQCMNASNDLLTYCQSAYPNSYLIEVYENVDFSLLLALLICQISKSIVLTRISLTTYRLISFTSQLRFLRGQI